MDTVRHTGESECLVKTEAEIRVRHLKAKGYQGLLAASRSWERGMEQILPQNVQEELILPTPGFRFPASRTRRQ